MRRWKSFGWIMGMVFWALLATWVIAEAQAVFTPTINFTDQFSSYVKGPMARFIGLTIMAGLAVTAITTRGHGVEIFAAMLVMAVVLAFMFNAEKVIFPMLGFETGA